MTVRDHQLLYVQPNYSGKRNTAKGCTEYSRNICSVLYGHSLDVLNFINRTLLLDVFSCKNHSKMQFDNFTGWL